MQLLNNAETVTARGKHAVKIDMTSGTAKLQWKFDGDSTFADIPDSSLSASGAYSIDVPPCTIRAVLTGDATLLIDDRMVE